MILDRLEQADRYANTLPGFSRAFEFLRRDDLAGLPVGRHDIDGNRVYAIVARGRARPRGEAKLEAHRKYVDIQFVVSGTDEMGWKNRSRCTVPETEYNDEEDFQLFSDVPDAWVAVGSGSFAVFFPEDAHAPLIGEGEVHKVVVKVAVA